MTDWSFPPDLQERYERIVAETRRLQKELGVKPRTMEQRFRDYLAQQAEEQRRLEEQKKFEQLIGKHRPPPKWKV